MSSFGKQREANDGYVKQLYTGVANFKVTDVNPDHETLKKIYGENVKEPKYIGEGKSGEGENEIKYPQIRIDLYLESEPKDKEEQIIKTKVSFYIGNNSRHNKERTKIQCINAYGNTAWLTREQINAKEPVYTFTGSKGTYKFYGEKVRAALNGEEEFIDILRNLLHLPNPDKIENKKDAESYISINDWKKIISGDVSLIKSFIKSTNNKIGVLLGVKTVQDKIYQDTYNKKTLRQHVLAGGKFKYLREHVENTQANGGYPSTDFGDKSYKLNIYNEDAKPTSEDNLFDEESITTNYGNFDSSDFN